MSESKMVKRLIVIYASASVLGLVLIIPFYDLATVLFIAGASSPYITFMLFCSESLSPLAGIFAFSWFSLFPLFLAAAYLISRKKNYTFFWILTLLDFIVALLYGLPVLMDTGLTGRYIVGADLVASTIYFSLLTCALKRNHKTHNLSNQKQN